MDLTSLQQLGWLRSQEASCDDFYCYFIGLRQLDFNGSNDPPLAPRVGSSGLIWVTLTNHQPAGMSPDFIILITLLVSATTSLGFNFTLNGFKAPNVTLDGIARITSTGALQLTNFTTQRKGQAFYPYPATFKETSNGTASSFSTTFVFAVKPNDKTIGGDGIAFTISPARTFPSSLPSQFLGIFNRSNNGNISNHIVAVELDTIYNSEFSDINDNHVGININGLNSISSSSAGYFDDRNGKFINVSLITGKPVQVWVEYDGSEKQINVTLAPWKHVKPKVPLVSLRRDLSPYLVETMYVGFSASTGSFPTSHYLAGWSFKMNGEADPLSSKLPRMGPKKKFNIDLLKILLPISISVTCSCSTSTWKFTRRQR